MLSVVGNFASLDALTKSTVPADILFADSKKLGVPGPMTETEALTALKHIASKNQVRCSCCDCASLRLFDEFRRFRGFGVVAS
jgi:glycine cleavage system pyridoxal-binding protein P